MDELSNWYVRRCRERYWQSGMEKDKIAAYMTLYTVLYKLSLLTAPFVPFISEAIYQNLVRSVDDGAPISVHLCDFPIPDESFIDESLETDMRTVLDIVTLGRACRSAANIKNRQPLSKLFVVSGAELDRRYFDIVKEELNIREVEFTGAPREFVTYRFKPQLKTLGPRYGKLLPKIGAYLAAIDGDAAKRELNDTGKLAFTLDSGEAVELSNDDLLVETARRDNFVSESNGEFTVAIDAHLTDELLEEGSTRELISKIQNMRKEARYEVSDHILLDVRTGGNIADVFTRNFATVARETLTDGLLGAAGGEDVFCREWKFGDELVRIYIKKAGT